MQWQKHTFRRYYSIFQFNLNDNNLHFLLNQVTYLELCYVTFFRQTIERERYLQLVGKCVLNCMLLYDIAFEKRLSESIESLFTCKHQFYKTTTYWLRPENSLTQPVPFIDYSLKQSKNHFVLFSISTYNCTNISTIHACARFRIKIHGIFERRRLCQLNYSTTIFE